MMERNWSAAFRQAGKTRTTSWAYLKYLYDQIEGTEKKKEFKEMVKAIWGEE